MYTGLTLKNLEKSSFPILNRETQKAEDLKKYIALTKNRIEQFKDIAYLAA